MTNTADSVTTTRRVAWWIADIATWISISFSASNDQNLWMSLGEAA